MTVFQLMLMTFLIVCAVSASFSRITSSFSLVQGIVVSKPQLVKISSAW